MTEDESDAELHEFAQEVAEAIEQCLDIDYVKVEDEGALIIVSVAGGARYRLRIREDE